MSAQQIQITTCSNFRNAPKVAFTSALPAKEGKNAAPGPGHYGTGIDSNKDKFKRSASWSIGGATPPAEKTNQGPGPGAYKLGTSRSSRGACFSKENRLKVGNSGCGPGPGAYHRNDYSYGKSVSIVGKPEGGFFSSNATPGPGAYDAKYTSMSSIGSPPKVGFGASSRGRMTASRTPGPGAYNNHETFKKFLKGEVGDISIKGRYPERKVPITPGPGMPITQFPQ